MEKSVYHYIITGSISGDGYFAYIMRNLGNGEFDQFIRESFKFCVNSRSDIR